MGLPMLLAWLGQDWRSIVDVRSVELKRVLAHVDCCELLIRMGLCISGDAK
jgi:hypothetical protein